MTATVVATALFTFLLGTLVEYWGHRLMHMGRLLKKHHAKHHRLGSGQGWLGEFRAYGVPTAVVGLALWLIAPAVGTGWWLGGLMYAAIAAYAHQVQHEMPRHVWWSAQPQHAVHHYHQEWHHNFGITVAWWDRVFGTYKAHEPLPMLGRQDAGPLTIHWVGKAPPLAKRPTRRSR